MALLHSAPREGRVAAYEPVYTAAFYDHYGDREWARLDAAYGRLQAVIHLDFLERHVRPGDRVLDAGCGPGRFALDLVRLGARVTELDLSRGQLRLARERLRGFGGPGTVEGFLQADVADLGALRPDAFDVVVCFGGALSYVLERRFDAIAELARVLRPGGRLLLSVMSRYGAAANVLRRGAERDVGILRDPDGQHLWRVLESGDLPPFSSSSGRAHPAMHLYSSDELRAMAEPWCDDIVVAGSCVTAFEGSPTLAAVAEDPRAWQVAVDLERRLCTVPGLVDGGSHLILGGRKREA